MRKKITYALILLCAINIFIFFVPIHHVISLIVTIISILLAIAALYVPVTFEYSFEENDWEDQGDCMILKIPSSIHKLGRKVSCQLYQFNKDFGYEMVLANIYLDNGNVTIAAGKNARFTGKVVIQA